MLLFFFFHASFTSYRNYLFLNAIDSIIFKTDNEVVHVEQNNHGTPKGGETPPSPPPPSELKCLSVKSSSTNNSMQKVC